MKTFEIRAFGHTVVDKSTEPTPKNLDALLETARRLHKVGFHDQARDYENRARIMRRRMTDKAWESKPRPKYEKGCVSRFLASVPHIKEVEKRKEQERKIALIAAKKFDQSIKLALVQVDRHAAWDFHQHKGEYANG